jgi:hypothetical protein
VFFQTPLKKVNTKLGELIMATKAQTCANRRNALKSTGPQTTKKELRKINSLLQNKPNLEKKSNERNLF